MNLISDRTNTDFPGTYLPDHLKAILISVSEYPNLPNHDLLGPDSDANTLAYFLYSNWKVSEKNILQLRSNVTYSTAKKQLEDFFNSMEEQDHLLFYYRGHGLVGNGIGKSYMSFSDSAFVTSDGKRQLKNVLSFHYLNRLMLNCKASIKLRIFDCCHSGERLNNLDPYLRPNIYVEGVNSDIVQMPEFPEIDFKEHDTHPNSIRVMNKDLFQEIMLNQSGWVTFCACNVDEIAWELTYPGNEFCGTSPYGEGLFSKFFMESMYHFQRHPENGPYYIEDLKTEINKMMQNYIEKYNKEKQGAASDDADGPKKLVQHMQYQCSLSGNLRIL